jgi:hypothetical protein
MSGTMVEGSSSLGLPHAHFPFLPSSPLFQMQTLPSKQARFASHLSSEGQPHPASATAATQKPRPFRPPIKQPLRCIPIFSVGILTTFVDGVKPTAFAKANIPFIHFPRFAHIS